MITGMITRRPLPPAPPPEDEPAWPDEAALLAERATALAELTRRGLGVARLLGLWLLAGAAALGWACVALAVQSLGETGFDPVGGAVALFLAALLLIPAAVGFGFWLHRGAVIRQRLTAWAELTDEPAADERALAHSRSVLWLLPSVVLSPAGAGVIGVALAEASSRETAVSGTAYQLGLGATILLTGAVGIAQALTQRHWAVRLRPRLPPRPRGGAHR
ncbi:hypothetical protein AB0O07_24325 [Streptomyces sp. NPDC093085]|uniref:hypothetical protein n=1 Tax=Streptomyces sp. NPDC093085 TaxID=3155068 RepID=UPI0034381485